MCQFTSLLTEHFDSFSKQSDQQPNNLVLSTELIMKIGQRVFFNFFIRVNRGIVGCVWFIYRKKSSYSIGEKRLLIPWRLRVLI